MVVIAIATFKELSEAGAEELWLSYGSGQHHSVIPIHEIATSLSPAVCRSLPLFHAITGCDTVSSFAGRGKKTAWNLWQEFHTITTAFEECMKVDGDGITEDSMGLIERFVILLYDRFVFQTVSILAFITFVHRTSGAQEVNEARKILFSQNYRSLENVPPTKAALVQHVKRAVYQARIWSSATTAQPTSANPGDWG